MIGGNGERIVKWVGENRVVFKKVGVVVKGEEN